MKKILSVAIVAVMILASVLTLGACATQHSIKFYVGDTLYKEYRCDTNGTVNAINPNVLGSQLVGWFVDEKDAKPFDFSTKITSNLVLHGKYREGVSGEYTFNPTPLTEVEVNSQYAKFGDYGMVTQVAKSDKGVYIVAEGYYGYHLDENPSMTMGIAMNNEGVIKSVFWISQKNQTEGYVDLITDDYLNTVYPGVNASQDVEVAPATGATRSCIAITYAVRTSSYYAAKALGIEADTGSKDIAEINGVHAGEYTKLDVSKVDVGEDYGKILFAASGVDSLGKDVIAVKVRSSQKVNFQGNYDYGWDSTIPGAATMIVVIDKATSKVVAYSVVNSGASKPEYFDLPKAKLDAYLSVAISSETVFDQFKGGLVLDMDVPTTPDPSTSSVITGTSIIYTGATVNGTYTSQFVRHCYSAVARYFVNYAK